MENDELHEHESEKIEQAMRGHKHLLDPRFRYTPSTETDLRKTFARIDPNWAPKRKDENDAPADIKTPSL